MIHLGVLGNGDVHVSYVLITIASILVIGFFGLRFLDKSEALTLDRI